MTDIVIFVRRHSRTKATIYLRVEDGEPIEIMSKKALSGFGLNWWLRDMVWGQYQTLRRVLPNMNISVGEEQ